MEAAALDAGQKRGYRAPWWLPGGHAQTLYAALLAPRPRIRYRSEQWETPDGDFIELDWVDGPPDSPLVILFHGLEGGSRSHYALSLMQHVLLRGWRGVVPHFRGCGRQANRLPRAYHSGDLQEVDWILRRFRSSLGAAPHFAAGVSLGGNALLKWLAARGAEARQLVHAAAVVSAPVDLPAAGFELGRGFNLVYTWNFLSTLKRKSLEKLERFPGLYDAERVKRARDLHEFDDVVTAPLHGFKDADEYWSRASSKPELNRIGLATLLVHARNDPFLPGRYLPHAEEVSPCVTLDIEDDGGHAGFVTSPFPGRLEWLPRRLLDFFESHRAS
ncbi:MAG TPA: alpha/beta fold hydrolase [Burkholderiales bacterium]|nr:alpha/beta fold hydrolase [Burkholderiales bacterium]